MRLVQKSGITIMVVVVTVVLVQAVVQAQDLTLSGARNSSGVA
jgi:flagellar biosynthesis protein FliQ